MYIYVITNGVGQVKIGITKSPKTRLKQLQTGCATELKLRMLIQGDRVMERRVHKLLTPFRTRRKGEWFNLSEDEDIGWLCEYIVGLSAQKYGKISSIMPKTS